MDQQSSKPAASPTLIAGMIGLGKNMFGLMFNRIELAALEFSEVRSNLLKIVLVSALGIMALWFAIAYWTVLLVYLTWDSLGPKILLIVAVVFTALAVWVFLYVRSMLAQECLSMPATMTELRNDHDALM
jgi:uncharacterized membrane protein YqjE